MKFTYKVSFISFLCKLKIRMGSKHSCNNEFLVGCFDFMPVAVANKAFGVIVVSGSIKRYPVYVFNVY